MEQARDYRLMEGWLGKQHPDILNAYVTFKEDLQKQNPGRLDLAKSPMFREFTLKKRGPAQIPTEGKGGKMVTEKSKQDRTKRKVVVMGEKRRTTNTNSDEKEEKRRRTASTSSSSENSDEDIGNTENKGPGQGTKAKTEADIIEMMGLMSSPTFRKSQHKDTP